MFRSLVVSLLMCLTAAAEEWELRMTLDVPRVFDNMQSKGYRKYQKQNLRGFFSVTPVSCGEPLVEFRCLENLTHKINGRHVTYDVTVEDVKWHGIGSNKTGEFNTRSVTLSLICEPSYAIGEEPTEDNSLHIVLSGKGNSRLVTGFVAGQLGCGCAEYGHVSPTRIWMTSYVVDTAAVYGKWRTRLLYGPVFGGGR